MTKRSQRFILWLSYYKKEICSFPYFVNEDIKTVYINFSNISEICEEEVTVLSRSEYDKRLKTVVEHNCIDCEHYEEDMLEDNLKSHSVNINLDGFCHFYFKKESD